MSIKKPMKRVTASSVVRGTKIKGRSRVSTVRTEELVDRLMRAADIAMLHEVKSEADRMKKGIRDNTLGLPALAQSTIDRKGSDVPLVDTGEYVNSIEVGVENIGKVKRYKVAPREGLHSEAQISYQKLGAVHEYGTSKIPARPHFRPTAIKISSRAGEIANRISGAISKRLAQGK